MSSGAGCDLPRRPVFNRLHLGLRTARIDSRQRSGRQFLDAFENAEAAGHVPVTEVQDERVTIDFRFELGVRSKRLQLRPEKEMAAAPSKIKWLLAESIAHDVQTFANCVPYCEGKHPVEPF